MNEIKDYWASNHTVNAHEFSGAEMAFTRCPRLECADGFTMSVQASHAHYCSPRFYVADGDYHSWEIGFPAAKEELIMSYAEEPDRPTDTVYGYVPTEIINTVIQKHGGLKQPAAA